MQQHASLPEELASLSSEQPFAAPTSKELLEYFRAMLLIRRFEEKAGQLYGMGLIGGFCHLYIGQEAIAVGMQAVRREGDQVITSYRDHGLMLATGMPPRSVMAELTGRAAGKSRGKGGSMHMFDTDHGFYGGHGIVGSQVSLGTGIGFANRYRQNGAVCFTYLGDGAVNQGQVAESFNMAAMHGLPVVYIIENNHYAMGTSVERSTADGDLSKRGLAFGIPGEKIDGMDVIAVRDAGLRARRHAALGSGPMILEMETYRYRGHSMSDPATYRTRDEVDAVKATRDPIDYLREILNQAGLLDAPALKELEASVRQTVNDAAEFAKDTPEPDAAELITDVYAP
jgi:pyruvate dehydrogenase E1 component alpha subunit